MNDNLLNDLIRTKLQDQLILNKSPKYIMNRKRKLHCL